MANERASTIIKWGLGGLFVYSLLNDEAKKGIRDFASQLLDEFAASERRKALAKQLQNVPDLKP